MATRSGEKIVIDKWELVPDPSDRFPKRHRVNVAGEEDDIRQLLAHLGVKAGRPWKPRRGSFRLSFYIYDLNPTDRLVIKGYFSEGGLANPGFEPLPPAQEPATSEVPPHPSLTPPAPDIPLKISHISADNSKTENLSRAQEPPLPPPVYQKQKAEPEETETPEMEIDIGPDPHDASSETTSATDVPTSEPPPEPTPAPVKPPQIGSPPPEKSEDLPGELLSSSDSLNSFSEEKTEAQSLTSEEVLEEVPASAALEEDRSGETLPIDDNSLTVEKEVKELVTDQGIVSEEPDPDVPRGYKFLKVGYILPANDQNLAQGTHDTIEQTLKSRNMPFVFQKKFIYPYTFINQKSVEKIVGICSQFNIDGIICFGDEKRLISLSERCAESDINLYTISLEDARKKYWRMGLIARLVVRG